MKKYKFLGTPLTEDAQSTQKTRPLKETKGLNDDVMNMGWNLHTERCQLSLNLTSLNLIWIKTPTTFVSSIQMH